MKNALALLQLWRCSYKFKSRRIGSRIKICPKNFCPKRRFTNSTPWIATAAQGLVVGNLAGGHHESGSLRGHDLVVGDAGGAGGDAVSPEIVGTCAHWSN
jgi:hypothetical protein